MPQVSVIIPTYNRAELLPDSLESVFAQTHRDLDIVVVDDGSTDDTERVIASCGGAARYLRQDHRGVSAARNAGLAAATAPYLAYLDSDDLWVPEKLALELTYMQAHGECALVCSNFTIGQADGGSPGTGITLGLGAGRARSLARRTAFDDLLDGNFVSLCTALMRTADAREVGGFDESLQAMEDWDFALRVAARHTIAFLERPLAHARRRGGNLSADRKRMHAAALQVLRKLEGDPDIVLRWGSTLRRSAARALYDAGHWMFYESDSREARAFLWQSIRRRWLPNRAWRYLIASCLPRPAVEAMRSAHRTRAARRERGRPS